MAAPPASLAGSKVQNRREWPRYQAAKPFLLAAHVDGHLLFCTVADISLGGARLMFDADIPDGETLELSHEESGAVACERVWQGGRELGVAFDFSEESLGLISICIRGMIDVGRYSGDAGARGA